MNLHCCRKPWRKDESEKSICCRRSAPTWKTELMRSRPERSGSRAARSPGRQKGPRHVDMPFPSPWVNCSSSLPGLQGGGATHLSEQEYSTLPNLIQVAQGGHDKSHHNGTHGHRPLRSIGVICHVKPTEAKPGISAMVTVPYILM